MSFFAICKNIFLGRYTYIRWKLKRNPDQAKIFIALRSDSKIDNWCYTNINVKNFHDGRCSLILSRFGPYKKEKYGKNIY